MKRVSVVGTVHKENGLANISELLRILERIHAEVIFLESPEATFDDYLTNPRTLEANAATRYRELHRVALVPVDLPTPDEDFFRNAQCLYARIERTSPEYCRLVDLHVRYVSAYGFAYLNSEHCSELWSKLHEVMLATIDKLADHRLAELYEAWIRTNELRDREIINNIETFCWQTSFSRGALLIGGAHRQSVRAVARRQSRAGSSRIRWQFAGFVKEPPRELGE